MKKLLLFISFITLISTSLSANSYRYRVCKSDFDKDPCPLDSYSIVEVEKVRRAPHNWMVAGDTLNPDLITGGVGSEKRRNLPREAYFKRIKAHIVSKARYHHRY